MGLGFDDRWPARWAAGGRAFGVLAVGVDHQESVNVEVAVAVGLGVGEEPVQAGGGVGGVGADDQVDLAGVEVLGLGASDVAEILSASNTE